MKMEWWTVLSVLCLLSSIQVSRQDFAFDMRPDLFDDQYIGCLDQMEPEMEKVLTEELKDKQFGEAWKKAKQSWKKKYSQGMLIPTTFHENYGTAFILYTLDEPYPFRQHLKGNVSIAGQSRDFYMESFHLKAFHFYLTRGLQHMSSDCWYKIRAYLGMNLGPATLTVPMRFDGFTSASESIHYATRSGSDPLFIISTCYGVDIDPLTEVEKLEILIPIGETFNVTKQVGSTYELESTGLICSYFNCAYLGAEKRERPVCKPGVHGYRF